ncbi:MAG: hypothetical protein DMF78_24295 [Acidobacteria bacterium]|nr:MAG: hypothetical protein DMF78_24295 [Acidobacteriota bacterium]
MMPAAGASAAPASSAPSVAAEAPSPEATAPTEPYDIAHARIEEERGEPMGLAARVTVPPELQHYSDRRRFLAVQMADSQEEKYDLPQDDADLVAMYRAGKLVEMPLITDDYILYDIGTDATDDPMVKYDPAAKKDVPLFASAADLDAALASLADQAPHARTARARAAAESRRKFLAGYYDDPAKREELLRKGVDVASLAANFEGTSYDLADPAARARFDARLLSLTRPQTRPVIEELAREYRTKFGRLLPITSLVRTERYQRRLSRVNANATHVEIPPHTTGCAFDISYRYMAADEQQFLMDRIAQLEDEGKVEAIKERRNHFHVFVFADGRRPPEALVAQFLDEVDASHAAERAAAPRRSGRARHGARAR